VQTKRLATEILLLAVLGTLSVTPVIAVGLLLDVAHGTITLAMLLVWSVFLLASESVIARVARRLGLPATRQIGKRHRA
jgi:hypothetical protein